MGTGGPWSRTASWCRGMPPNSPSTPPAAPRCSGRPLSSGTERWQLHQTLVGPCAGVAHCPSLISGGRLSSYLKIGPRVVWFACRPPPIPRAAQKRNPEATQRWRRTLDGFLACSADERFVAGLRSVPARPLCMWWRLSVGQLGDSERPGPFCACGPPWGSRGAKVVEPLRCALPLPWSLRGTHSCVPRSAPPSAATSLRRQGRPRRGRLSAWSSPAQPLPCAGGGCLLRRIEVRSGPPPLSEMDVKAPHTMAGSVGVFGTGQLSGVP